MSTAPSARNLRVSVSEEVPRELYITQRLTIDHIAARCGLASTTIARRFVDLGIDRRCRGPLPGTRLGKPLDLDAGREWTPELAYAIGLITTTMSRDHRADHTQHEPAADPSTPVGRLDPLPLAELCWPDAGKSLRLGPLQVPDEWMRDFLRGCIDGDGSIVTYVDRYNTYKKSTYVYTRLFVSIVSASPRFLARLKDRLETLRGVSGALTRRKTPSGNDLWCLRYAKRESLEILRWISYAPDVPCLRRKREIAEAFLERRERSRRGPGRPMVV